MKVPVGLELKHSKEMKSPRLSQRTGMKPLRCDHKQRYQQVIVKSERPLHVTGGSIA
jgi:hypothetical protein